MDTDRREDPTIFRYPYPMIVLWLVVVGFVLRWVSCELVAYILYGCTERDELEAREEFVWS